MAYSAPKTSKKKPAKPKKSEADEYQRHLTKWKTMIVLAKSYQKKHGNFISTPNSKDGRWDLNIKALDGDFNSHVELGDEAIDVNVTHSTIETLLSPLWTTEPHITIEPTMARVIDGDQEYDNILHAQITEHEINYWTRELKMRKVVKKCILDCAATNQGFSYLGYIKKKAEVETSEGESTEPEPQIDFHKPFVKRISPKNVLMPAGYYDLEECPWIAIGFQQCVGDVKDRYDCEDLAAETTLADTESKVLEGMTPEGIEYLEEDDSGYVMVWQVWDKRREKLCTLTLNYDKFLDEEDWPYEMDGFPVEKLRFNLTPDQQFGMPLISAFLPQQKELNAARTSTRRRESRTKAVVFMKDMPEGVEDAYKKAEDGTIINLQMAADVDDLRKVLTIDQGLPPANSAYNYGATQIQDLFLISGLGAQQRGSGDPNIDSATASALVDKWAQIRQTDLGDIVREFWLNNAKKLWMILKQFPNVKRDMLVTGPTGQLQRITYTLAELKGEFNFTMDLGSMFQSDPISRRNNAFARYNLLRADPLIRPDKLVTDLLKSDNIHDVESYMMKLLSPQEEFMKMLQGLPCEAQERDDHIGHMKAHTGQRDQLMQLIDQGEEGSPEEQQARSGLILLVAHVNDHARIMQMLDSKNPSPTAGSPMQENSFREDMAGSQAGETEAEMAGGPVGTEDQMQTPAGVGVQ